MSVWTIIVAAALLQAPQAELQTLSGQAHAGKLIKLTEDSAELETPKGPLGIPLDDVLELSFPAHAKIRPPRDSLSIRLTDGSHFLCTSLAVSSKQAQPNIVGVGEVKISARSLASIRFAPAEGKIDKAWDDLRSRDFKNDALIIRKGDVLDFLGGVIGEVDDQSVKFLLDGDELSLPREKVFGLIYFQRNRANRDSACVISLASGGLLHARSVQLVDNSLSAKLLSGGTVKIPINVVSAFDYSGGKVVYLSELEPRDVKYVPYFDITWKYRRNHNLDGGPLRVGGKTYSRGLSIHSRTTLLYRLRGDYRRFQAVMAIDDVVAPRGHVHVVIRVDDTVIFESDVKGTDDPRMLDLDVSGARDLEIMVDFGEDLDIADHLDLADARVIK